MDINVIKWTFIKMILIMMEGFGEPYPKLRNNEKFSNCGQ